MKAKHSVTKNLGNQNTKPQFAKPTEYIQPATAISKKYFSQEIQQNIEGKNESVPVVGLETLDWRSGSLGITTRDGRSAPEMVELSS